MPRPDVNNASPSDRCGTCQFFARQDETCHRFPPQIVVRHVGVSDNRDYPGDDPDFDIAWKQVSRWPKVEAGDWCGEFTRGA